MIPYTTDFGNGAQQAFHIRDIFLDSEGAKYSIPVPVIHTNGNAVGCLLNTHIYCPVCGTLWAKELHTSHPFHLAPVSWTAKGVACRVHGGGLLLSNKEIQYPDLIPIELLRRELLIELSLQEKEGC